MPVYSHSRLSTFEQCRQKFKFQYIDRIRIPGQSIETFLGSMVHEALEKLYEDVRHKKVPPLQELLGYYRDRWENQWSDEVRIVRKDYTRENYFDMGAGFIGDYYAHHHPFDHGRTLGLETQDMLDLGEGVRFHVRIDRLTEEGDGVYSVNDYKTNRSLPRQEELDRDRQLAAYSIWVRERFPDARRVRLVWHYLAHDRHMESERSVEQLEELKTQIRDTIGRIEACRAFPPTTSALCDWCDYKSMCPAWTHALKVSDLTADQLRREDGAALVNRLAELTAREMEIAAQIADVREDLIRYARQFGFDTVVGSEAKAKLVISTAPIVPKKGSPERIEMEEKLKELGLYGDLLTLDAFAVKKLDDETIEELGLTREERFRIRLGRIKK